MDRVLIRLSEEKTSNILMPESFKRPKTVGFVVAIGPEVKSVRKGQKVMFHAFDELPTVEKDVVAVRENSLIAILEDDE
ncbi:MAG: hypothetical protein IJ870_02060 [Alphaproteobacteria bacterium]|nr:hypothetical protein [Alphaproteobacteria bacterium]